jgi:hypothetical protein
MIFNHPDARRSAALKQIKDWARELFGATEEAVVVANELRCVEPGCPPLEVNVALLTPTAPVLQLRLHKAAVDVTREDLEERILAIRQGAP